MTDRLATTRAAYRAGELTKGQFIERMHEHHRLLYEYTEAVRGTEVAAIEISDSAVVMTSRDGVRFACDPEDRRIAPVEALNFGRYEDGDAQALYAAIEPGTVVFDVGANIGWYSLHIATRFPTCRVHAFEPIPATYEYLNRNLALNRLVNVTAHPFGLSDATKELTFYVYPEGSGGAASANNSGRASVREVTAKVRTIDEFAAETGVRPDFIKIDVEGAELFAFRGALATFRAAPPAIFTEMLRKWAANFGYHPNDIVALLGGLGYGCFVVERGRLVPLTAVTPETTATNFFFLHRDRHAARIAAMSA